MAYSFLDKAHLNAVPVDHSSLWQSVFVIPQEEAVMPRLHRNNGAEWVMVIVLTPFAWMVRAWNTLRGKREKREPSGSAAGSSRQSNKPRKRSTMIEGLPPRTMN
jgi:hypothetical protein